MSGPGKRAEGRSVTIVVCDDSGSLLGSLSPFDVATPWWQDLEPIRRRFPMLTVLRLLHGTPGNGGAFGGQVTYLAESGPGSGLFAGQAPGRSRGSGRSSAAHAMGAARRPGRRSRLGRTRRVSSRPGSCRATLAAPHLELVVHLVDSRARFTREPGKALAEVRTGILRP